MRGNFRRGLACFFLGIHTWEPINDAWHSGRDECRYCGKIIGPPGSTR